MSGLGTSSAPASSRPSIGTCPRTSARNRLQDLQYGLRARNYIAKKVDVLRLDGMDDDEGEGRTGFGLTEGAAEDPTWKILSALDLSAWLTELPDDDQELLALRAAGYTLEETGKITGSSTSAVFGRGRRLGTELAERAGMLITQTKKPAEVSRPHPRASRQVEARPAKAA